MAYQAFPGFFITCGSSFTGDIWVGSMVLLGCVAKLIKFGDGEVLIPYREIMRSHIHVLHYLLAHGQLLRVAACLQGESSMQ